MTMPPPDNAPSTPNRPILYSFRRCPYAIRARLALSVSGTHCALREVRLANKPAALLAASPKGTVPVLQLADGSVIDQSIDIMRWALARSDPERWLDRDDADLIARTDGEFKHSLDRYKYPDRHDGDAIVHRDRGSVFLHDLNARLATSRFLCGEIRGMADAAIMPFVRQFAAVDRDWFAAQPIAHVQTWLADQLESRLFAAVMDKWSPWSPGDAVTIFPADRAT